MKKTRSTKRALVLSALAILMCVSMLVGSTFAWFTDSVTSARNQIVSGNLDVVLYYSTWDSTTNTWSDYAEVNANTKIFDENALYEPGYTEVVKFKVENAGSLALKYQMTATIYKEEAGINVYNEPFNLSEYIYTGKVDVATITDRATAAAQATEKLGTGLNMAAGTSLLPGASEEFALVLTMPTTVGNEANHIDGHQPSIEFGIALVATQFTYEEDDFGKDYDENAWHPDMIIFTTEDLEAALSNGVDAKLGADVAIADDIVLTANLDLGGNTLSANYISATEDVEIINGTLEMPEDSYLYAEDGVTITLENVVIDSDKISAYAATDGTLILKDVVFENTATSNPIQNYGGTLVMDNVTVAQSGDANTAWYSSAVQVINKIQQNAETGKWEIVAQANTTINSGTYTGKKAVMISAPGGNVTINGGTFIGSEFAIQDDFAPNNYTYGANYESVVTINGGNFIGEIKVSAATELVIKGGTFDVDPTAYVADGYAAVKNDDGTYTVIKGITNVAEFTEAIKNGGNVVLTENIELTSTLMAKKDVVIDLNGNTITAPSSGTMFQSSSDTDPSIIITSSADGAVINAGSNAVLLGYGSTEISNVTINIENATSTSVPFKVYGDLTLGEGTVVNVDNLGTSLINNNGAVEVVIDGAQINIGEFKVNGGSIISLNQASTLVLNDTDVVVENFYISSFGSYFISKVDGVTVEDCTFDVTGSDGLEYTFEASNGKYRLVQK